MIKPMMMMGAGLLMLAAAAPAVADNAMQVCSQRYKADKAANKVPAGQTWIQYLAACRATLPKPAATAAAKAVAPAGAKAPSAGQLAARDRQKKCGQMWSADKAAGKIPAGQTWPKYWSACNTKLKG